MGQYILDFQLIGKTMLAIVGGKGASLGELSRIEGIQVPDGFCVSTDAFKRIIAETAMEKLLDQLSLLNVEDRAKIRELSGEIRCIIERIVIPKDIQEEITDQLTKFDESNAYAIRSSATAEDLPTASFAGQQDTYLNVIGKNEILKHISKCWASLFTERAVIYRIQNGFDHQKVQLSVVVQKMVFPQVAGILFTADPVTSNRKVLSIDASFGLGEALVSGIVNADNYQVSDGTIVGKKISAKKIAIYPLKNGGTKEEKIKAADQNRQALTDGQILRLNDIGRKIEKHFGSPQDIEWCLVDDTFYIVQSRPITTLFPIPKVNDAENHVYVSVGHNQMMTDALKPLGRSFFQLKVAGHMHEAGGRLFVDIAPLLSSPESSKRLIQTFGQSDVLIRDAITTISRRKGFIKASQESKPPNAGYIEKVLPWSYLAPFENNETIVPDLIKVFQTSMEELKQNIQTKSGVDLFGFVENDISEMKRVLFTPQTWDVIKVGMYATFWVNRKMLKWLGEKNAADPISQSVPNNVTSEMGLALMDVADVIRPYPEIIAYLKHVRDENFLDELGQFNGGKETRDAINAYLDKYGMRCAGEIDITKTRWSEKPNMLISLIINNIKNFPPDAARQKFEQGKQDASQKEQELLDRLRQLPDGIRKVRETKRMIGLIRNLIGYREYPKYGMISRYFVYKQALMKEAEQLVKANVIHEKEDVYYLTFGEFREVVRTRKLDYQLIDKQKAEFKINEKLTPPRVMTSDGEIISSAYKLKNLPANAIPGLPVSSGIIEGRARVILNMENADIEEGDILVTTFTDPSWTPLFVSIKGLVTEVGGLMTHGAVIAREYGLPAVVGVDNVTKMIKDGQRIRVNGTDGFVEIL
jgi:phosphoenolpyruvate synthase/pyruvate phosphate dikinase